MTYNDMRIALIITKREVRDQLRDWRIIAPILILTLIFPAIMNFTARSAIQFVEKYGANIIGERLIPFLLMIVGFFPISVSLVIALESFVGEKERRSIEPLLVSPLSDLQLYFGKLIAVLMPPIVASYLGIAVYLFGVYRQIGWVAEPKLLIQILLLTFVQALVMVTGAVVISTQTTSVRASNLLASFIIIPMAFLIQGESVIMFWGQYNALWWIIIGLAVLAGLLLRTGISHFNREELLGRELDVINFRRSWRVFIRRFTGNAKTIRMWYKDVVLCNLEQMKIPIFLVTLLMIAGVAIGVSQSRIYQLPESVINLSELKIDVFTTGNEFNILSPTGIFIVWIHNLRVLLLAMLLGVFSFGIMGLLVDIFPMVIVGYFMGALSSVGVKPIVFLAGLVLPHGIFEIPALIIAGAAMYRMGAGLASPSSGRTVGEGFINTLADWANIMVAIVIPLLLLAATIEVLITPHIAVLLLGG